VAELRPWSFEVGATADPMTRRPSILRDQRDVAYPPIERSTCRREDARGAIDAVGAAAECLRVANCAT
jgi:hypothetical protein